VDFSSSFNLKWLFSDYFLENGVFGQPAVPNFTMKHFSPVARKKLIAQEKFNVKKDSKSLYGH